MGTTAIRANFSRREWRSRKKEHGGEEAGEEGSMIYRSEKPEGGYRTVNPPGKRETYSLSGRKFGTNVKRCFNKPVRVGPTYSNSDGGRLQNLQGKFQIGSRKGPPHSDRMVDANLFLASCKGRKKCHSLWEGTGRY